MINEEFIESIRLEGEEWRDVVGWEGIYYVSSYGRIARMRSKTWPSMLVKPQIQKNKKQTYYVVQMHLGCKRKHFLVHRLVAIAFIPNPYGYECVDHIDGNGINNNVTNLRWCNRSMNNNNPVSLKRQSLSHIGKINTVQNKEIVQLRNNQVVKSYRSMSDAEQEGFSRSCVSRACNGKLSSYKGYKWMYLSDYESLVNKSKNT